jgi:aspartyl-tRNA(Asn)/glutamyl-tRNA(Gln) amidotransferase subunit C
MTISRDEVLHVASLARLELSGDEVARFQEQLSAILDAVGKVRELDLSDVPPTSHPLAIANVWAEDELHESLSVEEALANAPDRQGDLFRVPPA